MEEYQFKNDVHFREKLLKVYAILNSYQNRYNKKRTDFENADEYNDYLEEIEDKSTIRS